MAFVNFSSFNGEDFVTILHGADAIKLNLQEFSHLMLKLQGLESEIIKKSKQNGSRKITGSQRAQLKKRIKKPKWTPNNPQFEKLVSVFSEHLVEEIRSIMVSQCVGCFLGKEENHDICINKQKCVEDYFEASMKNLDDENMHAILCNEYEIYNTPSIEDLLSNKIFIKSVKTKLIDMM